MRSPPAEGRPSTTVHAVPSVPMVKSHRIALISAAGFHIAAREKGAHLFVASLQPDGSLDPDDSAWKAMSVTKSRSKDDRILNPINSGIVALKPRFSQNQWIGGQLGNLEKSDFPSAGRSEAGDGLHE